jgi:hypothetical protein
LIALIINVHTLGRMLSVRTALRRAPSMNAILTAGQ